MEGSRRWRYGSFTIVEAQRYGRFHTFHVEHSGRRIKKRHGSDEDLTYECRGDIDKLLGTIKTAIEKLYQRLYGG